MWCTHNGIYTIYTMEYYSVMVKKEILLFVATWTELEGIMLTEIIQAEKYQQGMVSLLCEI